MPLHSDTSARARALQAEILSKKSPEERMQMARELTLFVQKLAFAGIRQREPHLTDDEIWLELAARRLGADLVRKIYGSEKRRA
jgi:hypothetical protein